ncbi:hypothetical protein I2I05_06460 [Hymenobacter sp. BT683]|uniref:DUF1682 domain-containing protein n=1 Tax=Hymenobacter jeongseonensis TaxID=2791027 RepID=A0ABS0IG71_9BACT|nr:hypothetical protein [Hymenobacter jeongseonensis]MBF9237034.1 hypothetical protein [Hymenobacter jeongseonensis]
MDRKFWLLRGLRFLLFAALFLTAAVFLTQYLWNWLVPEIFNGPAITLAQTFGLLVLSRILFGGWFRGGQSGDWARRRKAWQQRMAGRMETLSPDEREKFRQQMQQRCGMTFMRRPTPDAQAETRQPA